jgi:hypothetical protein
LTDNDRKKAFDRHFKALWITFRSGSDINSEAFKMAEANYYRLSRIEAKDFEAFFSRFTDSFPSPADFQRTMSEFISAKYPTPRPEPTNQEFTPAGRTLVRIMTRRYPPLEGYRPDLNVLRAILFDIAFRKINQPLDDFWRRKLESASEEDRNKIREYIVKTNLIKELGI